MVILVKLSQPQKEPSLIDVIEFGKVIAVSPVQL